MNEKQKYLSIYQRKNDEHKDETILPGKMGGGYGRICWGENMLETLKAWKVNSILDVGCGYGNFCDAATLFVPHVYGLDIASVTTGNIIDNPAITFLDGEAKSLPLASNAVEWITSFDCLEHCLEQDIDAILSEFDRVAQKGFVLSISYVPCEMDGMPLHMTVKPESWWIDKLSQYGTVRKSGHAPITGAPYLICSKPVKQRVIAYCSGSLGTRLRSIAFADAMSRRCGRSLALLWQDDDPLCRIAFKDLFTASIPLVSEDSLMELEAVKIYANVKEVADHALISGSKYLRRAVEQKGCFGLDALAEDDMEDNLLVYAPNVKTMVSDEEIRRLITSWAPVSDIENQVRQIAAQLMLDKSVMGVHARGTDFGVEVDAYIKAMETALKRNPNQKFLICTDDQDHEAAIKARFQSHVITRPKVAWPGKRYEGQKWALNNLTTSESSIQESLIDLYLLGYCDLRIYHESSAFGQIAKALGMDRKEPATPASDHGQMVTGRPGDTVHTGRQPAIYYLCPDIELQSAGIRRLYRHVHLLHQAGFDAAVLHLHSGFRRMDMPRVPVHYLDQHRFKDSDIIVVPEGFPTLMDALKHQPGRRFVIALNWDYVFKNLPTGVDWRHFKIERVLAVSPVIANMIAWAMQLPTHVLGSGIDHTLYYAEAGEKKPLVVYIERKSSQAKSLKRLLAARNPAYVHQIEWSGLDGLPEEAYAAKIREASIFLNLSMAEGYPTSCLEAMAAGTLVAGYDSVGGRDVLRGSGADQNCLLAPMGDYLSLAYLLAPELEALLEGSPVKWDPILANASKISGKVTPVQEAHSVIGFWSDICTGSSVTAPFKKAAN